MLAAQFAALLALVCARAETFRHDVNHERSFRKIESPTPAGCLYEGRWFVEGAQVPTGAACLRCRCARAAVSCARVACAATPDPPPPRCHLLHRRDACCPELHCPDGVTVLEQENGARSDDDWDVATPASLGHACVEGGTVFSAGSALAAHAACEACFCLGGRRRCTRPRCLPPPRGCRARPAPGVCCPARYYCDLVPGTTSPPHNTTSPHDCMVDGVIVAEGERVLAAERALCSRCFCLRGATRCQPLSCAPALHGCKPMLRPGDCCPHQYQCHHKESLAPPVLPISNNALTARIDDRSFHGSKFSEHLTSKSIISTLLGVETSVVTKKEIASTSKVKRKTNDPPPTTVSQRPKENATSTHKTTTPTSIKASQKTTTSTTSKPVASTLPSTTDKPKDAYKITTEQPEGSVKIIINGTINCSAELSSALPNATTNDTDKLRLEGQPRVPFVTVEAAEAHTTNPNDIITDKNISGDFDENDTFTINVTSSLRTNTSHSTSAPFLTTISKGTVLSEVRDTVNISKKTKEEYDYDYAEPTLPPSLPNLKIIPFVAADAVVGEDDTREILTYPNPIANKEDKFPVYYPNVEPKETPVATRREDVVYTPTQYPVFQAEKKQPHLPPLTHKIPSVSYRPGVKDLTASVHEYTVSTSFKNRDSKPSKSVSKLPPTISTFELKTPAVNLFSPPVETEGGFLPKDPGIIDEYYAGFPTTVGPTLAHLTTSMQLDTGKGDCTSSDGRLVPEGDSVSLACSVCSCAWGELHCSPRPCPTPAVCRRRPAALSSGDLCCGELICDQGNNTTTSPTLPTRETAITLNETKIPFEIKTEIIPFDPPHDRAPPTTEKSEEKENSKIEDNKLNNKVLPTINNITKTEDTQQVKPEGNNTAATSKSSTEIINTTNLRPTGTTTTLATIAPDQHYKKTVNETNTESQEYEDEEEEDEGFSFGSVLKLLLSDTYDTTTTAPYKVKLSTFPPATTTTTTIRPPILINRKLLPKPSIAPFVPMPHHTYNPPKKTFPQNTVQRIDHLVLGEATAIKKSTPRPIVTLQPSFTPRPLLQVQPVTNMQFSRTTPPLATTQVDVSDQPNHLTAVTTHEVPRPAVGGTAPGAGMVGLLKLAGCNIYGQMYRVGRIIAELSTPCQECRCTELGVQCRQLSC